MNRNIRTIILLALTFASCNVDKNEYVYENSDFTVILTEQCRKIVSIKLINQLTLSTYSAVPDLIVYDDGIPVEGGLVADYNTLINNDIKSCTIENLYSCDSVYEINTDTIILIFGQEKETHRRLDFSIYESTLYDFKNGNYTLYAVD